MLLEVDVSMASMLLGAVTSTVESSYNLIARICKKIITHQTPHKNVTGVQGDVSNLEDLD